MSAVEHYFENLLFHGHDIKGEPNKKALSKEVQDAVEQCVNYIKYTYENGERKTGKWVDDGQYAEGHSAHGFHCSLCGGYIIDYVCQVYDENPHCKWCGEKMEGAEKDD